MDSGTATRTVAGRYRLGDLLGRGGMADVYDGHDTRLDRPVAVKLLRPELAAKAETRRRFEVEAQSAARLTHPNVVAVYDTGEDDGLPFIVMERLPGETLADRVRAGGALDPDDVVCVAGDVLGALAAAHDAGIVHRDVKPANILLAPDGRAKVADFGIAKTVEAEPGADADVDLTATDVLLGTPAYLPPERIDGDPATPRGDLYALGVVLYEALSGQRAFTGSTPIAVATAVKHLDPPPLDEVRPDLPPHVVAAVARAMMRDPGLRFETAADMAAALHSGLSGDDASETVALPTVAPVSGPSARTGRRPRRSGTAGRAMAVALGSILALSVVAGVLSVAGRQDRTGSGAPSGLPAQLRSLAGRLETGDGARGPDAADGLRSVADAVEAGGGAQEATELLAAVVAWNRDGLLFRTATAKAVELLERVPGVDTSVTTTTPPTTAVTAPPAAAKAGGKGGHKGHKDD